MLFGILSQSALHCKYFDIKRPAMSSRNYDDVSFEIEGIPSLLYEYLYVLSCVSLGATKDIELIASEAATLGTSCLLSPAFFIPTLFFRDRHNDLRCVHTGVSESCGRIPKEGLFGGIQRHQPTREEELSCCTHPRIKNDCEFTDPHRCVFNSSVSQ